MIHVRQQLNAAIGAAGVVTVCAGMLTVPVQHSAPQIEMREIPVVLQALTINDIVTRVSDAITYGVAIAPVWYLGLPVSIPMSIGIGFGLADLIPVVGESFGLTWTLDQVGRIVVGSVLAVAVYALGPPFMAVSSLLGITYPSVIPAAARPASPRSAAAQSASVRKTTRSDARPNPRANASRAKVGVGPTGAVKARRQAR